MTMKKPVLNYFEEESFLHFEKSSTVKITENINDTLININISDYHKTNHMYNIFS